MRKTLTKYEQINYLRELLCNSTSIAESKARVSKNHQKKKSQAKAIIITGSFSPKLFAQQVTL